jgi:tetratricopeptide (TPR) repeat protein
MARLTAMRRIAGTVFVLVLGFQSLAAQTSNAGGGLTTDASQNVVLTGNVVMADGSPPPQPVGIERVCGPSVVRVGYTDVKGFFNFQLAQMLPTTHDASENGDAASNGNSVAPFSGSGIRLQLPSGNVILPPSTLSSTGACDLRGALAGFRSTSVMIHTTGGERFVNVGTLVLLSAEKQKTIQSATSMNAPKRARRAYQRASAHLQKSKLTDAQADLEEAVKLYPRYADAWSDLGWLLEQQNRLGEAREAFLKAREADDNFTAAYVGLASVAVRQFKWAEAQELSARGVQLNNRDFPMAYYYNAVANFQLGQVDKAENSARMAERLDVRHALPQVNLLLGSILATKLDYAAAADQLRLYLTVVHQASNAERIRQRLAELERLSTSAMPLTKDAPPTELAPPPAEVPWERLTNWAEIIGTAGNPKLPALDFPQGWAPPDIDQLVPPVRPGVSCPVHDVLSGVSARARDLMDNLQEFSATERIEHVEVDKYGNRHAPVSAIFTYVAEIRKSRAGSFEVEEYRNGSTSQSFPASMATRGTAAHALIFHPSVIGDFTVACEGLGSIRGQPAWQLRFAESPDRPSHFRAYKTPRGWFLVKLKGRAWVTADTYQVMRMETDLVTPVPEILLQRDHVITDYLPVEFKEHNLQLWLPETTQIYGDLLGHRFHRRHSFSNFELFSVDTTQQDRMN